MTHETTVTELEKKLEKLRRTNAVLEKSERHYRQLVQSANSIILRLDNRGNVRFINGFAQLFFGYAEQEILGRNIIGTILPEKNVYRRNVATMLKDIGAHPERYLSNESKNIRSDGESVWIAWTNRGVRDENGVVTEILCVGNDITERKQLEKALLTREQELEYKTRDLEEMNAALRVFIKKGVEDKVVLAEKTFINVKQLIEPYLQDLKGTNLSPRQGALLDIIGTNLTDFLSPFARSLTAIHYSFTPKEIQVANFIKQGKKNKDIADIMGLSLRTIEFHRAKIRKKLGLKNGKQNLQTHLLLHN